MSDSKSTGVKRKKSTDKYVSIIPKGPGGLKPYQIFTKEQFAKYNDSSVASKFFDIDEMYLDIDVKVSG